MKTLVLLIGACVAVAAPSRAQQIPADDPGALARLNSSPRHGEYVKIDAGGGDSLRMWVVFPERRERAPVVVVIQEIFGLSDWLRNVGDQLAADGFIAVVPDLLSGKGPNGAGSEAMERQAMTSLTRTLTAAEYSRRLNAAARYGAMLPASSGKVGVVGFCWGGARTFEMAYAMDLNQASVVYYGASPPDSMLTGVRAPVLGLYGSDDARVNATIPGAQAAMQRLGKPYEVVMYEGAGHGFLRQSAPTERDGANARAAQQAWTRTIAFFREKLR